MSELKFIFLKRPAASADGAQTCSCSDGAAGRTVSSDKPAPAWVIGTVQSGVGPVRQVSTDLTPADRLEHIKCRVSAFRNSYAIEPGLYAVGSPDSTSDVLVSANYKLSFDSLRRELGGQNIWVLVLDTRGINVWCAAGKGTFGNRELVRMTRNVSLEKVVSHRRLILPQLSAPGVSAHTVARETGFRPVFGPVRSSDLPAYIRSGYSADAGMRAVSFGLRDRFILTPMELRPALKYFPHFALLMLITFGLQPSGILFREAVSGSLPFLGLGIISIFSGALITPLLLPYLPFRSFAIKGFFAGLSAAAAFMFSGVSHGTDWPLLVFALVFFPAASSFIALQFTGSTTFTGPSGVKKELRIGMPLYLASAVVSCILLIVHKLYEWRLL